MGGGNPNHDSKGRFSASQESAMTDAVSAIQAWDKAGRPRKNWANGGELARDAANAIAQLEGTFRSLPEGQYWRGTNRPDEVNDLISGRQLVSTNHVTGQQEGLKSAMATLEKHTGIQSSLLDWLRHN